MNSYRTITSTFCQECDFSSFGVLFLQLWDDVRSTEGFTDELSFCLQLELSCHLEPVSVQIRAATIYSIYYLLIHHFFFQLINCSIESLKIARKVPSSQTWQLHLQMSSLSDQQSKTHTHTYISQITHIPFTTTEFCHFCLRNLKNNLTWNTMNHFLFS